MRFAKYAATAEAVQPVYDLLSMSFAACSVASALNVTPASVHFIRDTKRMRFTGGPTLSLGQMQLLTVYGVGNLSATETDDLINFGIRNAGSVEAFKAEVLPYWIRTDLGREAFMSRIPRGQNDDQA